MVILVSSFLLLLAVVEVLFNVAVIGRRGIYYKDKRGILQTLWAWSSGSWESQPGGQPSLLLASALPRCSLLPLSCLPVWFHTVSPKVCVYVIPI